MLTVDIAIKDPKKPRKLTFPDKCVNCSKPKVRAWTLKLNTGAQKRGQLVQMELNVPLCAECIARENRIGNVTWIPFFVVGFLACAIAFVPVWLLAPAGSMPQTYDFPWVLGGFVGIVVGIIVGSLVEFGLRILFAPAYGKLLLKRPLTVFSVFNDSEDLVGFSTRFADNKKIIKMTFENDNIGREFIALNPQESV